jgi:hypothetical protein
MCRSLEEGGWRCVPHMRLLAETKAGQLAIGRLAERYATTPENVTSVFVATLTSQRETTAGVSNAARLKRAAVITEGVLEANNQSRQGNWRDWL